MLGSRRPPVQDSGFPVRQLADIALKGISPSVDDPTTAENAMEAMTALLVRAASSDVPSCLQAEPSRQAALLAAGPDGSMPTRVNAAGVRAEHGRHLGR